MNRHSHALACASLALTLVSARAVTFQISDAVEFSKIINTNAAVLTTNATLVNGSILEGPTWVPGNPGHLIFSMFNFNYGSTIAGLKKLVLPNTVTDFLIPPAFTVYNGSTLDAQERLISCQSGTAGLRVVMITNGVVSTLVSNCAGLKFYSPNDVVVKSDGTIWFTDPGFNGVSPNPPKAGYQGGPYVYRFDPVDGNGTCTPVITNLTRPNGLCFSPDESRLYVADYDNKWIRSYSVTSSNTLTGGSVLVTNTLFNGSPDGIRCDVDGRIWSSAGNGVHIFAPDGHLIGKIIHNATANLCFGGPQYKTLFMTGYPVVTSIPVLVAGMPSVKTLQSNYTNGQLNVSWPAPSTGFRLQETAQLGAGTVWTNFNGPVSTNGGRLSVSMEATNDAGFFRLRLN